MAEAENWQPIAQTLGFATEAEMLRNLYVMQGFSLSQLKSILGYCTWTIRRRLIRAGIPLRGKGGPNNRLGKRRLKHLSRLDLLKDSAARIAEQQQVHISTVYSEIKFREKEGKKNEVLPNNADKLLSETGECK